MLPGDLRVCRERHGAGGRGLHSSTGWLNLSASGGIGGACRGRFGGLSGVLGGIRGCEGVCRLYFVSEMPEVELKSGRV